MIDATNKYKRESIDEITKEINEQLSQIGEPNCADKGYSSAEIDKGS